MKILAWTDGSCLNNQQSENYGGWGVVLTTDTANGEVKEYYGGAINTTNNKMELTGAIKALERIKRKDIPVEVHVDSNYVVQGMNSWITGWKKRGWKKSDKKPVENKELWIRLDELASLFDDVKFIKTQAHVGITLNELADDLAVRGSNEIKEMQTK